MMPDVALRLDEALVTTQSYICFCPTTCMQTWTSCRK